MNIPYANTTCYVHVSIRTIRPLAESTRDGTRRNTSQIFTTSYKFRCLDVSRRDDTRRRIRNFDSIRRDIPFSSDVFKVKNRGIRLKFARDVNVTTGHEQILRLHIRRSERRVRDVEKPSW